MKDFVKKKLRDIQLGREADKIYGRERDLARGQVEREEEWKAVTSGKKTKAAKIKNVKAVLNALGSWSRDVQSNFEETPRKRRRKKKR